MIALSAKSQIIYYSNYDYTHKHQVIVQSNNEIGTNIFPVNLLKKYYNSDSITRADKNFVGADTMLYPSIGFENQYGFTYLFKPDSIHHKHNKLQFMLSADKNNVFSLVTTRDVLLNVMYGNSAYAQEEKKIKLSPTGYAAMSYQRIGLGVHKQFLKDSATIQVYAKANFVNVQKYSDAQVSSSYVRFDDTTYEATGSLHMAYQRAQNSNAYFGSAGKGFSIDAGITYVTANSRISANIQNAGAVFFKQVKTFQVDTDFVFDGYSVDFGRLIYDTSYAFSFDTVFNVQNHISNKNKQVATPYTIRMNAQNRFFKDKVISMVDVTFKNLKSFTPRILVSEMYQASKRMQAGIYAAAGGFTKWQYGLAANLTTSQYIVRIQVQQPHNLLTRTSLSNAGVFVTMAYQFN
jgi:hypothetical protein